MSLIRFTLIFLLIIIEVNGAEENQSSVEVELNSSSENIKGIVENSPDLLSVDQDLFKTALIEKNVKYCSFIKKKNKKIECFGIIKRNSGYCNMIKDKDLKNKCLSIALSDKSLCDKINDKTIKKECISLDR